MGKKRKEELVRSRGVTDIVQWILESSIPTSEARGHPPSSAMNLIVAEICPMLLFIHHRSLPFESRPLS